MPAKDQWLFWPVTASLAGATILTFLCGLPGGFSFLMMLVSLLAYPMAAIALLGTAVFLAVKKRPCEAASFALALLAPLTLWRLIFWATVYAHLALTVWLGLGQLSNTPANSRGFAVYDWSVGLVSNGNTFLIHDDSDEIALPMSKHKNPANDENGFGEECAGKVSHLLGHYYVCTF